MASQVSESIVVRYPSSTLSEAEDHFGFYLSLLANAYEIGIWNANHHMAIPARWTKSFFSDDALM